MGGISTFFPYLLCHLYQKFPGSQLAIDYQPYQTVIDKIQDESNEFALYDKVTIYDKPRESTEDATIFIPLFQYKLYCIVPDSSPIAHQNSISMKTLLKYPFVLVMHNQDIKVSSYELLSAFGQPSNIIYAADLNMSNEMLSAGLGVALKMIPPNISPSKYILPNTKLIPLSNNTIKIFCGYLSRKPLEQLSHEAQQIIEEIKIFMDFE